MVTWFVKKNRDPMTSNDTGIVTAYQLPYNFFISTAQGVYFAFHDLLLAR